jgi:hypothetical protein
MLRVAVAVRVTTPSMSRDAVGFVEAAASFESCIDFLRSSETVGPDTTVIAPGSVAVANGQGDNQARTKALGSGLLKGKLSGYPHHEASCCMHKALFHPSCRRIADYPASSIPRGPRFRAVGCYVEPLAARGTRDLRCAALIRLVEDRDPLPYYLQRLSVPCGTAWPLIEATIGPRFLRCPRYAEIKDRSGSPEGRPPLAVH